MQDRHQDHTQPATPTAAAPLVSVLMPAYNCARYVSQAVASVLAQTLADLELIIVDDASSDDTVAVVESCRDPRVRLLRNTANAGPAHSRNTALAAARGEWIALVDADDWIAPDRLERLHARASTAGADAVADDLYIATHAGARPRSTLFLEAHCRLQDGSWMSAADLIAHEIGALKPMFRRTLFAQRGHRYDPSVRYGEDYLLYLNWLLDGARLLVLDTPLYYLRRGNTGSLTTSRIEMARAALSLNRRLLSDPRLGRMPAAHLALARRIDRTSDLLVFYEVVCPLRNRQFLHAAQAWARSPRFLPTTLKRLPRIVALRLHRAAYRLRTCLSAALPRPLLERDRT